MKQMIDVVRNVARQRNYVILMGVGIASGLLFVAGMLGGGGTALDTLPEDAQITIVGILGFCLFFTWGMMLFFVRFFVGELDRMREGSLDNAPTPEPKGRREVDRSGRDA